MLANVYFSYSLDYFAGPAETQPPLHMWSLAVEEQFYLFYPLLLVAFRPLGRRTTFVLLALLALASFALSVWGMTKSPTLTFFLLPTRMWELLAGGLLAFTPLPQRWPSVVREMLAWTGMVAILGSGWFYHPSMVFPGTAALVPVLGAVLVILACGSQRPTSLSQTLSHRSFVFVGLTSYSLYLWHWPILAFMHYLVGAELTWFQTLLAVAGSFAAGVLSWRFVETPFRRNFTQTHVSKTAGTALAASLVMGCLALVVVQTQGLPQRLPPQIREMIPLVMGFEKYIAETEQLKQNQPYLVETAAPRNDRCDLILLGDSHGMMVAPLLEQLSQQYQLNTEFVVKAGVAPLQGVWKAVDSGREGLAWGNAALDYVVSRKPKNVILAGRWSAYIDGPPEATLARYQHILVDEANPTVQGKSALPVFEAAMIRTVAALENAGCQVWIMKQPPEQKLNPHVEIPRACFIGYPIPSGVSWAEHQQRQATANNIIDRLAAASSQIQVLDPAGHCFDAANRSIIGSPEGSFYRDGNHISRLGAQNLIRPAMLPIFEQMQSIRLAEKQDLRPAAQFAR
ncbi:acyltransferase [Bremerella cremea]|uniref:Acyltransferase n=2 Tax=Bremerella cremea TaxID=1031537 RepID=A0A368KMP8_9BACT|nr:acyltransferase [Bremerella cremea]